MTDLDISAPKVPTDRKERCFSEFFYFTWFSDDACRRSVRCVSPSPVALGQKLHRRTGCCWRPAGAEGSGLLQRMRKTNIAHCLVNQANFYFIFQENMWRCFSSAAGRSHRESSWSGTVGPCQTSRATEGSPTAAQRTHNRSPRRPPEVRTECLPPAARGPGTNGSPRSLCSSHMDQLMAQKHKNRRHIRCEQNEVMVKVEENVKIVDFSDHICLYLYWCVF